VISLAVGPPCGLIQQVMMIDKDCQKSINLADTLQLIVKQSQHGKENNCVYPWAMVAHYFVATVDGFF